MLTYSSSQWFSPIGIRQLFTVRICHIAEPAVSLWFVFLFSPSTWCSSTTHQEIVHWVPETFRAQEKCSQFWLHHWSVRKGQEQLPALSSCSVASPPSSRISPSSSWISSAVEASVLCSRILHLPRCLQPTWAIGPSLGRSSQGTQSLNANLRVLWQPYLKAKRLCH